MSSSTHGHSTEKKPEPKPKESFVGKNKDVVFFGKTNFRNHDRLFGIKRKDRRQHMYVIGKTGTGKSALLKNLAMQDIYNGDGVCLVDPHGEFVEDILHKIPAHRLQDVIYFNPADQDYHIGFNVLELPDPRYKHLVASGLMGIFTKMWANVWSARMEYILNNAVLALLDTPDSTLLGIPRLLVDKSFRQKIVSNIKDPVVRAFWIHEYESWQEKFRSEAIAPIQNKVGQFLSTSIVRNVVGQPKSTIDIFELMNNKKILLINVSKGRIGEDNASLLGSMFITKIQLCAMERVRIPEEERQDFFLYVDEFQNFATDSFANVLSEARKYRLDLVLAHQYVGQLVTPTSTKVRDAVFGNVGTMVVFRVGAADAEFLENEFTPEFVIQDIVNLPNYSIYTKLMIDGITSRPFSAGTLAPLDIPDSEGMKERIIESSRRLYSRPRAEVEQAINEWSGMTPAAATQQAQPQRAKAPAANQGGQTARPKAPEPSPRPAGQHLSDLAALGIEFESKKDNKGGASQNQGRNSERNNQGKHQKPQNNQNKQQNQPKHEMPGSIHKENVKPLSLGNLKTEEHHGESLESAMRSSLDEKKRPEEEDDIDPLER